MNETQQDRDDRDAAAFHADQLQFIREAEDALHAALIRPLTADEVAALAFVARIPIQEVRK
jgi:hypothetical protein